jgi:riboflavin synthase alpha subunit
MRKWFILFIFAILPLAASAETVQVGDLWYNLDDSAPVATVVSTQGESYSGNIVVPATIEYGGVTYTVTTIGENAFAQNEVVNSVVLSEGIQIIENSAFMQCNNMTWVELPSTITSIGYWSFSFTRKLRYVISKIEEPFDIDKSSFFADNYTLNGVESFASSAAILYVPAGSRSKYLSHTGWEQFPVIFEGDRQEEKVGDLKYAYATSSLEAAVIADDYSGLESVSIPPTVSIGENAYTVKAIESSAFRECINLNSVTLSEGLVYVGGEAFWRCNNAEFSALPSTIIHIGYEAFDSCNRIAKLVIPEGCTTIDVGAFEWCGVELKRVELPSTLTYIGERAFVGSQNLKFVISRIARPFAIQNNVFCKEEIWDEAGNYSVTKSDATLYVPSGTKASYQDLDGWNMFAGIVEGDLKEVKSGNLNYLLETGSKTATVIAGDYSNLKEVSIPSTISVDGNTYSVEAIDERAFFECNNLEAITLSEGLKKIGDYAFINCSNAGFNDFPSTITTIGEYAFSGCHGLTKVILQNCVSIGHDAFHACGGLKRVELSSSLKTLDNNAFGFCDNLEVVVSRLTTPIDIDKSVFQKNKYVNGEWTQGKSDATLYVPVNTKSAYQAIEGWNMFANIIEGDPKEATVDGFNYIYLESSKTAKVVEGEYSSMSTVVIPASITIDGESYTVNAIDKKAFAGCGYISKLELPSTITSIGERAFIGINTMVVSHIQTPFSVPESAFAGSERWDEASQENVFSKTEAKLYVPVGTRSSYLSTSGWDMFAEENVIEGEPREAIIDGLKYSYLLGSGIATVIAGDYIDMKSVVIPGTVLIEGESYSVTAIGNNAFQNCYTLESLVIEQGIQIIGNYAFTDCNRLTSITLPPSLLKIGKDAFSYCGSGNGTFITLELPSSLTSIEDRAFFDAALSSVRSRIVTPFEIPISAFAGTGEWENGELIYGKTTANLYVPEGTKTAYQKFEGWRMFADIYEGDLQETMVGNLKYAYLSSTKIATVISGDYSKLEEITIPSTVEIGGSVYQVKEIGSGAFRSCGNLQSVRIENGIEKIGKQAFQACWNAKFEELPSSITTIENNAFNNCNGITSLILPNGLQSIGDYAFNYCDGLQQLVLPSSLTSIGSYAFANCKNMTLVTSRIQNPINIPDNVFVTQSYEGEYSESASAATLCVPEGTKSRYQAIKGWTMFREILEGEMLQAEVAPLTYIYNVSSGQAYVTKGSNYSELRNVTVPGTVTIDGAKYSVTAVGARAFSSTNITSVTIEEGIKSIEQEAFHWCGQLTKITLPSSLEEIKVNAFTECGNLTSIEIPANVSLIREKAFSFCRKLSSIKVSADNRVYDSRNNCNAIIETATNTLNTGCKTTVIPESVTAIGPDAFAGSQFTEITIPSGVKTIGDEAFLCCDQFSEIVIPEGVESIGTSCFHSCYTMETIELPNSLKTLSAWSLGNCTGLVNLVTYIENPYEIPDYVFGDDQKVFERAKLYVPKGKKSTYQRTECWSLFKDVEEMIGGTMSVPTVKYNGRYLTLASAEDGRIYYSLDGTTPILQYKDTLTCYDLATVKAIAKRFGSVTSDTLNYKIDYVYDGVTAKTAEGGLLAKCFEWSGTDKVEMLDIDGTLNDDDFGTIRGLSKLKTLNMAASKMTSGSIPAGAFANTKLQWYVSPYTLTGVGANAFRGCDQLSAITWNSSSVELPEDVATDVANPNMLVYAKSLAMIPYALKNVVINGVANNITLADSTGNNNFYCPEEFKARRISYTHDYQQKTARGVTQGWETLALPFTVSKITHETKGEITPSTVEGAERPFWLYELGDNGLKAATQISANIPYLICMPNDDAYGDEYILGGRVTFSAQNVTITSSTGTVVSNGDRQFVPTYQSVTSSSDVYALNVGQVVGENPVGSVFVPNLREVRPFEAYSIHGPSKSRILSVSSLRGGDATGINDFMLNDGGEPVDGVVKAYSLSGALIKQGKREEVLRSLPKGLYIIDGKKIIK